MGPSYLLYIPEWKLPAARCQCHLHDQPCGFLRIDHQAAPMQPNGVMLVLVMASRHRGTQHFQRRFFASIHILRSFTLAYTLWNLPNTHKTARVPTV